ncbi:MAG: membrane protein insertion efficiency factor YidD [Pseudomonadota bacterium]
MAIGIIRLYRLILSPWVGHHCRYHPTCSAYGLTAFQRYGFLKGCILTLLQICACHPWGKRPWTDPVPERFAWRDMFRYNRDTNC